MRAVVRPRRGNLIVFVLLLALAATIFAATTDLPAPGRPTDPGAAGYPRLLAVVIAALGVALLGQRTGGEALPRGRDALQVAGIFALLVVYVNVLAFLGFILASLLFLLSALLLAGVRGVVSLIVIPPVFSILVYYLFYELFQVVLPRGPLESLIS
jgi:putative tricarboxylic transport membrane protein